MRLAFGAAAIAGVILGSAGPDPHPVKDTIEWRAASATLSGAPLTETTEGRILLGEATYVWRDRVWGPGPTALEQFVSSRRRACPYPADWEPAFVAQIRATLAAFSAEAPERSLAQHRGWFVNARPEYYDAHVLVTRKEPEGWSNVTRSWTTGGDVLDLRFRDTYLSFVRSAAGVESPLLLSSAGDELEAKGPFHCFSMRTELQRLGAYIEIVETAGGYVGTSLGNSAEVLQLHVAVPIVPALVQGEIPFARHFPDVVPSCDGVHIGWFVLSVVPESNYEPRSVWVITPLGAPLLAIEATPGIALGAGNPPISGRLIRRAFLLGTSGVVAADVCDWRRDPADEAIPWPTSEAVLLTGRVKRTLVHERLPWMNRTTVLARLAEFEVAALGGER
jgi:hypothetical protein